MIYADHEMLVELGVLSVNTRNTILNAIYHVKIDVGIPFEADDYIPRKSLAFLNSLLDFHVLLNALQHLIK